MGFRRAAKVDSNHAEIVEAIRKAGASVKSVAQLKKFVDIVVGYRGHNRLVEIKDGTLPPSGRKLTVDEAAFHRDWLGTTDVISSVEEAHALIWLLKSLPEVK